jgi:hypothetical protein
MSAPACCNHNCNGGRKCPFREPRDLTKGERLGLALLALLWAMAVVAVATGANP